MFQGLLQSRGPALLLVNNGSKLMTEGALLLQTRNYAARKGYREKREKARVKKEVVKKEFVPHNVAKKELLVSPHKRRC